MYKTSVYTLVNGNIKELAHWKRQKSQKVILPASQWLCVNVLLNNIKFYPVRSGVSILWGSDFWLFHRKEKLPLTQGLNCHSACDNDEKCYRFFQCLLLKAKVFVRSWVFFCQRSRGIFAWMKLME